jgi:ABC-type phosphate transport system substrate-binding protein
MKISLSVVSRPSVVLPVNGRSRIRTFVASSFPAVLLPCRLLMMELPYFVTVRLPNEATSTEDGGFTYKCATAVTTDDGADKKPHRTAIQVVAAYDAIAIVVKSGGVADQCIRMLGGGLTLDQLRYIYSSYSYAQLTASDSTWDGKSAVPNPEADKSGDKFWSELSPSCDRERIVKVGPGSFTGINEGFQRYIGIDDKSGESLLGSIQWFVAARGAEIVGYVQGDSNSIGYVENSFFGSNDVDGLDDLVKVPVSRNSNNNMKDFLAPTVEAIAQNTYPLTILVYMNMESTRSTLNDKTRPFMEYGYGRQGTVEVAMLGFVPISAEEKVEMLARLTPPVFTICFPADGMVNVQDRGPTMMKDVKIGDYVKVNDNKYSMVYSFGHFDEHVVATYLEISWAGKLNKKPLLISPDHLVFVEGHGAIPASTVKVGNRLMSNGTFDTTVTNIKSVVRVGAFAPFTKEGTLLVNDIRVSSYITLQPNASNLVFGPVNMAWLDMHALAHLSQAPHRVICDIFVGLCETETYTTDGISVRVAWLLKLTTWVLEQHHSVVTMVLLLFLFGVCATAATVEAATAIIASYSPSLLRIDVAATALMGYYIILKYARRTSQK